jgi:hypothetical protein
VDRRHRSVLALLVRAGDLRRASRQTGPHRRPAHRRSLHAGTVRRGAQRPCGPTLDLSDDAPAERRMAPLGRLQPTLLRGFTDEAGERLRRSAPNRSHACVHVSSRAPRSSRGPIRSTRTS